MINQKIITHLFDYYSTIDTKEAKVTKLLLELYLNGDQLGNKLSTLIEAELMIRYNLTNGGFQNVL